MKLLGIGLISFIMINGSSTPSEALQSMLDQQIVKTILKLSKELSIDIRLFNIGEVIIPNSRPASAEGFSGYIKKGGEALLSCIPYIPHIAGGSVACTLLGGLAYWHLCKNTAGIERVSRQVADVEKGVTEIDNNVVILQTSVIDVQARLEEIGRHMEDNFSNLDQHIESLGQSLYTKVEDESATTYAAIILLGEELQRHGRYWRS